MVLLIRRETKNKALETPTGRYSNDAKHKISADRLDTATTVTGISFASLKDGLFLP